MHIEGGRTSGARQQVLGGSTACRFLSIRMGTVSLVHFRPILGSRTRE